MHLVISCSLNKFSKSRIMARHAYDLYCKDAKILDLNDINFPRCDGNECYDDPIVQELKDIISQSRSILLASPIYNYDLNSVAKNLVELTGTSWNEKLVGFISAAGGQSSYMSPMAFANSLMLDFRCVIIPRFVYADKKCFTKDNTIIDEIKKRIEDLVDRSIFMSRALL